MKLLDASLYVEVELDETTSTIHLTWLPETAEMTHQDYKNALSQHCDFVQQYQVKYWYGDARNFAFTIVPELQEWTANIYNRRLIEYGLQKMALLVHSELFTLVSIEQTVDEMQAAQNKTGFATRYFDNMEDAYRWLHN